MHKPPPDLDGLKHLRFRSTIEAAARNEDIARRRRRHRIEGVIVGAVLMALVGVLLHML